MQNEPREPEIGYERALDCIGSMLLHMECELTKYQPETAEHSRIYENVVALNLALDCLERERDGVVSAYECEAARAECLRMQKERVSSIYGVQKAAPDILRAEWEQETDKFVMLPPGEIVARCSNCHEHGRHTFRYCPYCGAFMTKHKGRG